MKVSTVLVLVTVGVVATWAACSGGAPTIRVPGVDSSGGDRAAEGGIAYEEGLIDVSAMAAGSLELPSGVERELAGAAIRRGLTLATAGDAAGAAAEYDRAAEIVPIIGDWAALLAARAYAAAGDAREAGRRANGVPAGGAGEWAWRTHYDALMTAADSAGALGVAEAAAARVETRAERALAWSRAGEVRAARRDLPGALDAFRRAMRESPGTPGGLAGARGAHDLPGLTPEDRLLIGRTLLAHGGLDRGIAMLEAYAAAPGVPAGTASEVRLEAGRALFNARRYDDAERNLRGAADRSPDAAFLLARTLYRQGRQEQGIQGFLGVTRSHPTSAAAADALFLLGDLEHDGGRTARAAEYYRQAVATGIHNVAATDAAVRLAGMSLLAGDARAAQHDLNLYLAQRPQDRVSAPAMYWLGRVHAALGGAEQATSLYRSVLELDPFSYYGMLAARRMGTSLAGVRLPDGPDVPGPTAAAIELSFFRMDLLRDLDLGADADLELARLQEVFADDHAALYSVAEAMARHGQVVASALLGRRVQIARGEWDERLLRLVYPFPYRDLVVQEARRNRLDPYAVAGLIRQESLFNPIAVSPAGAVGLMQVMPQTASGLARRAGVANFQPAMLRDPATNVRIGTLYLADQVNRWGGRLSDVYGAYNAGPNRVVRWRQLPDYRDDEIYVERIPIA